MKKLIAIVATLLLSAVNVHALTKAGTQIDNNATLTYSVGGVTQTFTPTSNTDTFVVDKKIDFTLTNDDGDQIVTTPGASDVNTTWTLTNTGNADQNFTLESFNLNGQSIYNDADTADTGTQTIYYSTDGGTTWNPYAGAIELKGDYSGTNLGDRTVKIRVASDIPLTAVDGDVFNIKLEATAVKADGTTAETSTSGSDNKTSVDTVLAEGIGITSEDNTEKDGKFSRYGGYIIESPTLDLTKLSCVLTDGVTASNANAKRIPGATIVYVFDINNTGSAAANNVVITDTLSSELDGATVSNITLQTDVGDHNCDCQNGQGNTVTGTSSSPSDTDSSTQGISIDTGTIAAPSSGASSNHSCLSFEVKIK